MAALRCGVSPSPAWLQLDRLNFRKCQLEGVQDAVLDHSLEGWIPVGGEGFDVADVANYHVHHDLPQILDGTLPAVCSEKSS
jgi:hypothetical protein